MRGTWAASALLLALGPAPAHADTPGGTQAKMNAADGAQIYKQICAACHMANAKGSGEGAVPALAGNKKLANADYPLTVVLKGQGAMPWFSEMLTPAQIAAVVGYVRTHFGNAYPQPVTEADVKRLSKGVRRSME